MIKKILLIIVLGLLLISCSEDKTEKMLETCADENFVKYGHDEIAPLLLNLELKGKLLSDPYYQYHARCENDLRDHPKTFKTTWDR